MGVTNFWQALHKNGELLDKLSGKDDNARIASEVDGKVIAVDLSLWLFQAQQQGALAEHFTPYESAIKVAFERTIHYLRHGCLPVIVVDGKPPEEKRGAQQQRFISRHGYFGGGTSQGAAQFTALGKAVAHVLKHMGIPVLHAPGEAEATCAALCAKGAAHAVATRDGDALVYGAETVYHTLKLSTSDVKGCELVKLDMSRVRQHLGIRSGGQQALNIIAMLAGSDYDPEGSSGVGALSGFVVAKYLLKGESSDAQILHKFASLLDRPPNTRLLTLTKCTGCKTCGHEGNRAGAIKQHSSKNPCPQCPPHASGGCCGSDKGQCQCAFHRLAEERKVERIVEKVRKDPNFLKNAQEAIDVYSRQYEDAIQYVDTWLTQHHLQPGTLLQWRHRPLVQRVHQAIAQHASFGLQDWDLATVRGKMLPLLMEWDLKEYSSSLSSPLHDAGDDGDGHRRGILAAAPSASASAPHTQVEFVPVEIQKVQGQTTKPKLPPAVDSTSFHGSTSTTAAAQGQGQAELLIGGGWRYLLRWERTTSNLEKLPDMLPRLKKTRPGSGTNTRNIGVLGSQPAEDDEDEDGSDNDTEDVVHERQAVDLAAFDAHWLKNCTADHRSVRISAVRAYCPSIEISWVEKLTVGKKRPSPGKQRRPTGRAQADNIGAAAAARALKKSTSPGSGGRKSKSKASVGGSPMSKGALDRFLSVGASECEKAITPTAAAGGGGGAPITSSNIEAGNGVEEKLIEEQQQQQQQVEVKAKAPPLTPLQAYAMIQKAMNGIPSAAVAVARQDGDTIHEQQQQQQHSQLPLDDIQLEMRNAKPSIPSPSKKQRNAAGSAIASTPGQNRATYSGLSSSSEEEKEEEDDIEILFSTPRFARTGLFKQQKRRDSLRKTNEEDGRETASPVEQQQQQPKTVRKALLHAMDHNTAAAAAAAAAVQQHQSSPSRTEVIDLITPPGSQLKQQQEMLSFLRADYNDTNVGVPCYSPPRRSKATTNSRATKTTISTDAGVRVSDLVLKKKDTSRRKKGSAIMLPSATTTPLGAEDWSGLGGGGDTRKQQEPGSPIDLTLTS